LVELYVARVQSTC